MITCLYFSNNKYKYFNVHHHSLDTIVNYFVERKNSVDELAGNLAEKKGDYRDDIRLERELKRARQKGTMIYLLVEDKNGMENIEKGNYRSQYGSKAFEGKLASIEINYLKGLRFVDKKDAGREILKILYYLNLWYVFLYDQEFW